MAPGTNYNETTETSHLKCPAYGHRVDVWEPGFLPLSLNLSQCGPKAEMAQYISRALRAGGVWAKEGGRQDNKPLLHLNPC